MKERLIDFLLAVLKLGSALILVVGVVVTCSVVVDAISASDHPAYWLVVYAVGGAAIAIAWLVLSLLAVASIREDCDRCLVPRPGRVAAFIVFGRDALLVLLIAFFWALFRGGT